VRCRCKWDVSEPRVGLDVGLALEVAKITVAKHHHSLNQDETLLWHNTISAFSKLRGLSEVIVEQGCKNNSTVIYMSVVLILKFDS
jgi:hypothetical protein